MTALPPLAEAAIAVVLLVSLVRAFFGPPPSRADAVAATGWMLTAALLFATVLVAGHGIPARDVLTAAGVFSVCIAGWWLRGPRDDGEGDDGPELEPPPDWDEFDRLRSGWTHPRELV
jgi:uncharacterized membrane protein